MAIVRTSATAELQVDWGGRRMVAPAVEPEATHGVEEAEEVLVVAVV